MKKRIAILLLLCLLFSLCSCTKKLPGEVIARNEHYAVVKREEGYVLRFHTPTIREPLSEGVSISYNVNFYFDSVKEMKQRILTGDFSENDIARIRNMNCNPDGDTVLFDLDHIYQPILPEGMTYTVRWYGNGYDYDFDGGGISPLTQERFDSALEEWKNAVARVNAKETPLTDRDGFLYEWDTESSSGSSYSYRWLLYKLTDNTKTLVVKEDYEMRYSGTKDNIEKTTADVSFYAEDNGIYYYGYLKEMQEPLAQRLLSFGMEPV